MSTPVYDPQVLEPRWQQWWEQNGTNQIDLAAAKNPYYVLMMFPYPSAEGLHVGNVFAFTGADIMGRYRRLRGYDVFEPIGFDAFGIHSENFAMKAGRHPAELIPSNIANFTRQLKMMGFMFDWRRTVDTTSPGYYRWTQWVFLQLYRAGLAYRDIKEVNFCPDCGTVIADEQVIDGKCERHPDTDVQRRRLPCWFFRITDFAERLDSNLDWIDWSERTRLAQKNWIGRSQGAEIDFTVQDGKGTRITVFTTRPDTLFGATFLVLAPDHPLVMEIAAPDRVEALRAYAAAAAGKSREDRIGDRGEKSGVWTGAVAINPATGRPIPVFVADYVLSEYGTGAIMAVPAHDARDHAFARKYSLPIRVVIEPDEKAFEEAASSTREMVALPRDLKVYEENVRKVVDRILREAAGPQLTIQRRKHRLYTRRPSDSMAIEVRELTGPQVIPAMELLLSRLGIGEETWRVPMAGGMELTIHHGTSTEVSTLEAEYYPEPEGGTLVVGEAARRTLTREELAAHDRVEFARRNCWSGAGRCINSSAGTLSIDGLPSEEAKRVIVKKLEERGLGRGRTTFRLRDWGISRQRYWGPPIPIIYDEEGNPHPVPEDQLPVMLPPLDDFRPKGDGRGPLANATDWVNTTLPDGRPGRRETDVMDNFLDSAWYYLRYVSSADAEQAYDPELVKKWLPVDIYIGGNEHAVLHLLYTRFVCMGLEKAGVLEMGRRPEMKDTAEPFRKFRAHGLLIKEGAKMSKSRGNIVNPDQYVAAYGADTVRMYLMFLGPYLQGGDFRDSDISGVRRFLNRVFLWCHENPQPEVPDEAMDRALRVKLHQTIRKVGDDMEALSYNTAIAALMELHNELRAAPGISRFARESFVVMLAPFAPHLAEDLWHTALGHTGSVFAAKWPAYDPAFLTADSIELALQVNSRIRARFTVPSTATKDEIEAAARAHEAAAGLAIQKVIVVPGRLVNIITG
jgi:leucyl-tRNA synthetase